MKTWLFLLLVILVGCSQISNGPNPDHPTNYFSKEKIIKNGLEITITQENTSREYLLNNERVKSIWITVQVWNAASASRELNWNAVHVKDINGTDYGRFYNPDNTKGGFFPQIIEPDKTYVFRSYLIINSAAPSGENVLSLVIFEPLF